MDALTISRINKAHPRMREVLLNQYQEINKRLPKNCRLRFSHVYRSFEEQDALFKQRPKVTNAKGGQSIHNYGLAFDVVLLYDKDNNGTFESASWENDINFKKVVDYFTNKGWEWGGNWKFKDNPHFQMAFGKKWQDLKALIDSGNFIEEKGIKYPLL
jgi:peptidoglycan L-alanyl-D-glutamate endopeptidase CwlK